METLSIYLLLFLSGILSGVFLLAGMIRNLPDRNHTGYPAGFYHRPPEADRGLGLLLGIAFALALLWLMHYGSQGL